MIRPEDISRSPLRTPVGLHGGAVCSVEALNLATPALREVVTRAGVDSTEVDEVVLGQCHPSMEAPVIGRAAAPRAGFTVSVTGYQIDRRSGSGLQAVLNAVASIRDGMADLVPAGGAESMSNAIHYGPTLRWGERGDGLLLHDSLSRGRATAVGVTIPLLAECWEPRRPYSISCGEQVELSMRFHERAVCAQQLESVIA